MICNKCKTNINSDLFFCNNCGSYLNIFNVINPLIITVGKSINNNIVIKSQFVSSTHAQFIITQNELFLEDTNSSNGTFINKIKINKSIVTYKDVINFSSQYEFDWNLLIDYLLEIKKKNITKESKKNIISVPTLLNKDKITIGRTKDNDIVIENVKVSRFHAVLIKKNNNWIIEDLGSANGTYINGKRITTQIINMDDSLAIGGIPVIINSIFTNKEPINENVQLSAKNISFNAGKKIIVDDISLTFKPGEFIGLIGPSGAGKTTLMLMLNGIVPPSSGDVLINNQPLYSNLNLFKGQIGYVPQDDIIHRELKVGESLKYTARLRFDTKFTNTEISDTVNNVITILDLVEAKDVQIGTPEKRGISGGQRKRVNLGQELLTEPSILFLDEPTSGLDPKTDLDVMHLLKTISEKGKIVVLTTHNITSENFEILTHLVVLAKGGKLAYFGPADKAVEYFGVKKPYEIFDVLNNMDSESWKINYNNSDFYNKFVKERSNNNKIKTIDNKEKLERKVGLKQFKVFAERYFKIKLRDKISSLILLLQAPIIAFLIAIVFKGEAAKTPALFVLIIASIWLGCSNAAREIVSERAIYLRERMVNLKIPSYLASKLIVLSLLCLLQSFILAIIVTQFSDLKINIISLLFLLFTTSLSSLSIGMFVSSLVKTSEAAMGLIPIVLIPQVILGGLISEFGKMSGVVKILAGFMVSRWSFEAAMIGEFGGKHNEMISILGFNNNNLITDFVMIILFNIFFIILTGYSLKRNDK